MALVQITNRPKYTGPAVAEQLSQMYNIAKQARSQPSQEWKRNFRLTMNRVATALPAAQGVRANEVYPTIDARIAWMTDQEIACSVTPAADPYSPFYDTLDMLGEQLEVIINSVYATNQWYAEVNKMLWDAAMYGAGFLKAGWDQALTDGYGQVTAKQVSPWCLYIDPRATDLTDAEFIIEAHTMSPAEIERRYPSVAKKMVERAMLSGHVNQTSQVPNQYDRGQGKPTDLIPINAGQGPTTWGPPGGAGQTPQNNSPYRDVTVYECWIKENYAETVHPADPTLPPEVVVVSEWRVIVYAGSEILLDEMASNLFHTNRHPYVRYVDTETGTFWGSALVRDLGPCQVALNRLVALAQNNTEYTGNPIFVGVKGSGMDRSTFRNRPGQIYDVDGGQGTQNRQPHWLEPPNLPSLLQWLVGWWRTEMERIAGLQGGQRGEIPSGRATDKQVSATQEAGFVRIRSAQRNLEMTLRKLFELCANLVIINYDVPRTVAIVGPEGQANSVRLAANHFYDPSSPKGPAPMRFSLTVAAGASKPTSRQARLQEALMLHQQGAVDDQFLLQAARVPHYQQVLARTQQQKQLAAEQKALAGGPKGQPKGPGTGHSH